MAKSAARLALTLCLLPVAAQASRGDCFGWSDLAPATRISLASVRTGARVHFIKGTSEQTGCPAAGAVLCQRKDFLVSGDQVLVSAHAGDYSCGEYVNAKGLVRAGWLPTALLVAAPVTKPKSFIGHWRGNVEQAINIRPGKLQGTIDLHGEATFGALDPVRVKNGGVNIGSFHAMLRPQSDTLAFTDGDSGTMTFDKAKQYTCHIRMRRLGDFLLVEDNHNCGGNNVSFTGDYRRK